MREWYSLIFDAIVAMCAIIGAVLGIFNTFFQNKSKVNLTVENKLFFSSTWGLDPSVDGIPITIRNLSTSTVSIEEFGFCFFNKRIFPLWFLKRFPAPYNKRRPMRFLFSSDNLPKQLLTHSSISTYLSKENITNNIRLMNNHHILFYILTGDGRMFLEKRVTFSDILNTINQINRSVFPSIQ